MSVTVGHCHKDLPEVQRATLRVPSMFHGQGPSLNEIEEAIILISLLSDYARGGISPTGRHCRNGLSPQRTKQTLKYSL